MIQNRMNDPSASGREDAPTIYAHDGALGSAVLTRDPEGREHVATLFDGSKLGPTFMASDGWRTVEHRVVRV